MGLLFNRHIKKARFNLVDTNTDLSRLPYTVIVDLKERVLSFRLWGSKSEPFALPFDSITKCDAYFDTYDEEKKAWLGRTVAGGLIAGKTGAIIGATTAGTKSKRKMRFCIDVSFLGGVKFISFVAEQDSPSAPGVVAALFKEFASPERNSIFR